ncbi:MAG: BatA domain-containing protein [Planctomycetota bacterium]
MSFDRPLFLWAFLALAPVVAAFLMKRRRMRVVVSDLEAWLAAAEAKRAKAGWRTIRDAGSLAMNLAACAALALAAAGPRRAGPQGTDWALVFDVSASMGARDGRWRKAIEGADAFARALPSRDRFRIYLAGEFPRAVGGWRGGGEALPVLPVPEERAGDVDGALALVALDPGARPGTLRTVVWTDRACAADFAPRLGKAGNNLAIEAIEASREWNSAKVEVTARVANYASAAVGTMGWARFGSGADDLIPLDVGDLATGESKAVSASVLAPAGGMLEVNLTPGDALALDDSGFAAVPPLRRARVLVEAPEAKSPFLSSALAVLSPALEEGSGIVEPGKAKGADVFIFDRCTPSAFPCLSIALPEVRPAVDAPAVTSWATDHPILRGLDLSRLRVARARPLPRDPGATVLIDSAAGPLAAASADHVVLAFALEDSNLPLLAAFPLFVRNCVEELSRERPLPPALTGDWVTPFAGSYEVWEAGSTSPHAGAWRAGRPGVVIFRQGGVSRPLAVNFFDPAESALVDPPAGRELPAPEREPSPPWVFLAAAAALLLALDWALPGRR